MDSLLDLAILALRLAEVVGVLYAFLVVVLRAAGRGLQAARPERGPGASAASEPVELQLIVLEPASSGLSPVQVLVAADGTTLGPRGAHAELLILPDSAVSAEHARVSRVGREWMVVDLVQHQRHARQRRPG